MDTAAPRVMASHLLSEVEPIKGTMDVLADMEAHRQLNQLVDYLMDPAPTASFVPGDGIATGTETRTGPSNTNTIPDSDSDTEWQHDD
ncbi:hypothetical protein [Streptomyces uncialis]|uniref:hypothetical protein n=1 Tax=Streptomyces uncialis TaxID=1048205 RepID=UPI00386E40C8|nr:hypothetical protein OG268_13670 [Streptomyces uncialis]